MPFERTQANIGKSIRIDELIEGDMIDLQHDEYADPDRDNPIFMFEFVSVGEIEHEGGEGQNDDLISVSAEGLWVGFPPEHEVAWGGHPDHTVAEPDHERG